MDDDTYILDFCKYIRTKKVYNEYELFGYIFDFIKEYFRTIEIIEREKMHQMIYKNENTFYEPVEEHKFSDFKGKGNGLCSEKSIIAQNILSFFGFDTTIIMGYEKSENEGENHSYNLLSFKERTDKTTTNTLIDFTLPVDVYDINQKKIGISPYIAELEEKIICPDYEYIVFENSVWQIIKKNTRDYSLDIIIEKDKKVFNIYI